MRWSSEEHSSYSCCMDVDILNNSPENIYEHWVAIENVFFSGTNEVVGHVLNGCHKIWLIVEIWKWIDERKELRALIATARGSELDALELRMRHNRTGGRSCNNNDFNTVYCITKNRAGVPIRNVNGRRCT